LLGFLSELSSRLIFDMLADILKICSGKKMILAWNFGAPYPIEAI
jgi:hypothetical protein